jgi:hypothetical protein
LTINIHHDKSARICIDCDIFSAHLANCFAPDIGNDRLDDHATQSRMTVHHVPIQGPRITESCIKELDPQSDTSKLFEDPAPKLSIPQI